MLTVSERAAIEWEARLRGGDADETELAEFAAWHRELDNSRAWAALQERLARLRMDGSAARAAAAAALRVPSEKRRKLLRAGFSTMAVALAGLALKESAHRLGLDADWRSAIGQRQTVQLAGGARMTMDAGTSVYRGSRHADFALRVPVGQVLVSMPARAGNALAVATADGDVWSAGGELNVGRIYRHSVVAVRDGDAELRLARGRVMRVRAGESVAFTRDGARRLAQPFELVSAWTRGLFVADNVTVAEVADVFNRYRVGLIRATGAAATQRISGVFVLNDIDRAVQQVADSAPVELTQIGSYLTVFS
ncbi:FecR family protein [Paraburkholderia caballeronis]|uniref:FecR family protein n=1 Tax=Paraburkholderia caballeronis TaxID=416943 RepID=UPI001065DA70|nr:FecR domain-containing protein [Paraburkholderia caballeronis]TDV19634.1 FecR family protein [Paraburkholderia caballeronis]TDV22233.1 FecR family protein [Paraburkholderia caballeronis]TDV29137.1 FecR family protein [Paraburkholderia caballeronis]TDV39224.1 FecR family protein [Paraburkholderia caballeronis]